MASLPGRKRFLLGSGEPLFDGTSPSGSHRAAAVYLVAVAVALVRPVEAAVMVWLKEPDAGAV